MRRIFVCVLLTGFVLMLSPLIASTNPVSFWQPGELVGEPIASFRKEVAVTSEALSLDLRPLAQLQPAQVVTSYRIRNNGKKTELKLLFLSPGLSVESSLFRTKGSGRC